MVEISTIYSFTHLLDFDTIYIVDQDVANFSMILHTDLAMHDGFNFPCSHVKPNDDELNDNSS